MSRREQEALLALLNSFKLSRRVTTFDQLADGKAFMEHVSFVDRETMSQLTGSDAVHFKNTNMRSAPGPSSSPADNWVLKSNTLKRLYRLLLSYPLPSPQPSNLSATSLPEPQFATIAKNPKSPDGAAGLLQIARLCLAAGALGSANDKVIPKIQALDEGTMRELMRSIEVVMETLPKENNDQAHNPVQVDELMPPDASRSERDRLAQENDELRARCEQMTEQMAMMTTTLAKADKDDVAARLASLKGDPSAALRSSQSGSTEVERLQAQLAEEHLAETEAALVKQNAAVADLTKTVDSLQQQAADAAKLKDQLDEYRHTAERLQKSENVIEKYKKKLEESAGLRKELKDLEQENALLIDKTAELETEARRASSSRFMLDDAKTQIEILEKRVAEQAAEISELGVQLESTRDHLADVEREHERDRDELQLHQERVRELELGASGSAPPLRRASSGMLLSGAGDGTLDAEIGLADSGGAESSETKTALKLRVRALQDELAELRQTGAGNERVATLETLLAGATKARDRYQADYLEARRDGLLLQAKLDQIRSGRGGDSAQTALALRQRLDEVTVERDGLMERKLVDDVSREALERQLASAKLDLSLVDKDQRSMLAALRGTVKRENAEADDELRRLKEQVAEMKDKDRLHLEEIRKLLVEKVDLQSAGISQRERALEREMDINNLRTSLAGKGLSEETQMQLLDAHERSMSLAAQVEDLTGKLGKAKEFIKEQDRLFRADHARPVADFGEAQKSYEAQIAALKKELQVAQSLTSGLDKRYRLEQQLMLSAWHELGSRIVRDHVGKAGARRPQARPAPTSWLGRQRKRQEEAAFHDTPMHE